MGVPLKDAREQHDREGSMPMTYGQSALIAEIHFRGSRRRAHCAAIGVLPLKHFSLGMIAERREARKAGAGQKTFTRPNHYNMLRLQRALVLLNVELALSSHHCWRRE